MSDTDQDLDRLNDALTGIPVGRDAMTIGDLNGYLTALIVGR